MPVDVATQGGVVAALLAVIAYLVRQLQKVRVKERPIFEKNGQYDALILGVNAIRHLQSEQYAVVQAQIDDLRNQILALENSSKEGVREHSKIWATIREMRGL